MSIIKPIETLSKIRYSASYIVQSTVTMNLYMLYTMHLYRRDDRNKLIKLLLKIINNIIENPSNTKYRDLNYIKIEKKFIKCPCCMDILFYCGFYKSSNDSGVDRLLFSSKLLDKLIETKDILLKLDKNQNADEQV